MPDIERDCPICFRAYSWERMRANPSGGKCAHGFCEPCGEIIAEKLREGPFRCPMCRSDNTAWFADRFDWAPAQERRDERSELLLAAYTLILQNGPIDSYARRSFLQRMRESRREESP